MIAVLKSGTNDKQIDNLSSWLKAQGLDVHISKGSEHTVIGLIGDTSKVDAELIESLEIVESVKRISEPFKSANRKFHPDDSVIQVGTPLSAEASFQLWQAPALLRARSRLWRLQGL